jgi:hypothetical protein
MRFLRVVAALAFVGLAALALLSGAGAHAPELPGIRIPSAAPSAPPGPVSWPRLNATALPSVRP